MSSRRIVIGLTGGIASGKNLVAGILVSRGAFLIDADQISRDLTRPGTPLLGRIVREFGADVLNSSGTLNREKLGRIVFSSADLLRRLTEITHPAIIREIRKHLTRVPALVTVLMAPLLLEAGLEDVTDEIWVVSLEREKQAQRLVERDRLTQAEAERRIDSQMPLDEKIARAHIIIDNSGTPDMTREQVLAQWERLKTLD
jgi:dephospho-CoA kinase